MEERKTVSSKNNQKSNGEAMRHENPLFTLPPFEFAYLKRALSCFEMKTISPGLGNVAFQSETMWK